MSIALAMSALLCIAICQRVFRLMLQSKKLRKSMPQMQGGGILGWWPDFARPDRHRVVAGWTRRYGNVFFYRMFGHHVRIKLISLDISPRFLVYYVTDVLLMHRQ